LFIKSGVESITLLNKNTFVKNKRSIKKIVHLFNLSRKVFAVYPVVPVAINILRL